MNKVKIKAGSFEHDGWLNAKPRAVEKIQEKLSPQMKINLFCGDSLEVLKGISDNCIDSVVCDPPYGLSKEPDMMEVLNHWLNGDDYKHTGGGFMGKKWDSFVPGPAIWRECLRVLKPGGHLLAFFGSRTYDMGTLSIRLAGFEIRDQIMWVYGSGFPKSLNVEKATGDDRFEGWGTALKPAHEPICVARKPLAGTVADNVLEYGTGGLNIDGCRVGDEVRYNAAAGNKPGGNSYNMSALGMPEDAEGSMVVGRWPANFVHDGLNGQEWSRFFYCAKASKGDRNYGLSGEDNAPEYLVGREEGSAGMNSPRAGAGRTSGSKNPHPTVKPISLMEWLVRLVTPIGGVVLDPFMGSGSTGVAAMRNGFRFAGIELDEDFYSIARERINFAADESNEV